ncbi:unnamed protein product [Cuscuta epithymum]|uniref:F-box associated beta-propeller type 1 domain-containing protein n=1 Tax=Cuscuta epithymum TaxID=186058 RepID=A0AAV0DR79_9ASTE|nr:unnamed protein product [Cuscuta epithymum]
MPHYGSFIYGPCDGIYYLYHNYFGCRALWNPAINELKVLPEIVSKYSIVRGYQYEVYGFGLDPATNDDYKVVVIKERRCLATNDDDESDYTRQPQYVLVYSLRTDSWKYCGDLTKYYCLEMNRCYIYVNGCCYLYGANQCFSDEVIISFDMANYAQPSSNCLGV